MPINLCCDVCQAFIKRVGTHDAQRMLKNPEPIICNDCERTRTHFRKKCERVLDQLQREATQIKAGVESKFLDVMKEAIEDSVIQVTEGEKNDVRQNGETVDSKSSDTGSTGSETDETETQEESPKESVG